MEVPKESKSILARLLNDFAMTMQLLEMSTTTYSVYGGEVSWDVNQYSKSYFKVLKTVQPHTSLSRFAMDIQLLAINSEPYIVCGGAVSLDFNHYSKSY